MQLCALKSILSAVVVAAAAAAAAVFGIVPCQVPSTFPSVPEVLIGIKPSNRTGKETK